MPTDIASLGIKIEAKDVKTAVDELERLEKQSGKSEAATRSLGGAFKAFAGIAAAAGLGALASKIISNTIEAEQATAQLNATIESTGGAAGYTTAELQKMASALSQTTTYSDDAIIAMQSVLLTFTKIGGETVPMATAAILDMSTKLGTDLKSSAIQVGKALNDPIDGISALSRVGVSFTDSQKNLIKSLAESGQMAEAQAVILRELQVEFGGSAEAARNTFGGAIEGLKNSFGELLEGDGATLPGMTASVNQLNQTLNDPAVKEGFASFSSGLLSIVDLAVKATASIGGLFQETRVTAEWFAAYQADHISFFEWLTTGNEGASKRLDEIKEKLYGVADAAAKATAPPTNEPVATEGFIPNESGQLAREEKLAAIIEDAAYEKELKRQILEDEWDELNLVNQEKAEQRRINMLEHYSAEEEITRESAEKKAKIQADELADQISRGESAFSTMLGNVASHNKTFFKIQKIYRLSKLAMEAPAAIADSYAWGASWGGPPAGFAMASIAGAAMAGYASQLASASYGGSGSAAAGGSQNAVTAPTTPGSTTMFPENQTESRGSTTIIINGDLIGTDEYVQDRFLPLIKDAIDNRDYVLIDSNSRNGQELFA